MYTMYIICSSFFTAHPQNIRSCCPNGRRKKHAQKKTCWTHPITCWTHPIFTKNDEPPKWIWVEKLGPNAPTLLVMCIKRVFLFKCLKFWSIKPHWNIIFAFIPIFLWWSPPFSLRPSVFAVSIHQVLFSIHFPEAFVFGIHKEAVATLCVCGHAVHLGHKSHPEVGDIVWEHREQEIQLSLPCRYIYIYIYIHMH